MYAATCMPTYTLIKDTEEACRAIADSNSGRTHADLRSSYFEYVKVAVDVVPDADGVRCLFRPDTSGIGKVPKENLGPTLNHFTRLIKDGQPTNRWVICPVGKNKDKPCSDRGVCFESVCHCEEGYFGTACELGGTPK